LKRYKLKFTDHPARNINSVYFNDSIDSLYISRWANPSQMERFIKCHVSDLGGVESLYILSYDLRRTAFMPTCGSTGSTSSRTFQSLRDLVVLTMMCHPNQPSGDCGSHEPCFHHLETAQMHSETFWDPTIATKVALKAFKDAVEKDELPGRECRQLNIITAMGFCDMGVTHFRNRYAQG